MVTHSCGFCGIILKNIFLVTVDMHLKWPKVSMISSTTLSKTMNVLRQMFAAYGLPDKITLIMDPYSFLMILPHSLK